MSEGRCQKTEGFEFGSRNCWNAEVGMRNAERKRNRNWGVGDSSIAWDVLMSGAKRAEDGNGNELKAEVGMRKTENCAQGIAHSK